MTTRTPAELLQRRRLREMLVLFTLFVVPSAVSSLSGLSLESYDGGAFVISMTLRNVAWGLLVLYILDLQEERPLVIGSGLRLGTAVMIGAGLFGISMAVRILLLFTEAETVTALPVFLTAPDGWFHWVGIIVLMGSVAWAEELFFRGYLLLRLAQLGARPAPAVILAALLFSAGHGYQGVPALAFSFAAGLFLGILWLRAPGIVPFTLGHGMYNLGSIILGYVVRS